MRTAEMVRSDFLSQNSYTEDAFSSPEKTFAIIKGILDFHDHAAGKLKDGIPLEKALSMEKE
jgi:V/A-type H+-transporting ATPase subunit A